MRPVRGRSPPDRPGRSRATGAWHGCRVRSCSTVGTQRPVRCGRRVLPAARPRPGWWRPWSSASSRCGRRSVARGRGRCRPRRVPRRRSARSRRCRSTAPHVSGWAVTARAPDPVRRATAPRRAGTRRRRGRRCRAASTRCVGSRRFRAGTRGGRRSARAALAAPQRRRRVRSGCRRPAVVVARRARRAPRPLPDGDRGAQCISTSNMRPALSTTGASSSAVRPSTSGVADMASNRRSGRIVDTTSSASARPRSVVRFRSCTSSKMTRPTPGSSGSFCRRRVSTPSVTTSRRVSAPMWRSSRVW